MTLAHSSITAVVFDMDGLLIDSEPLQLRAWDAYLRRHGAELTPALLQRMLGLRLVDSAALVQRELRLPCTADDVARERDALFLESVPGNLHAMPGALRLIDDLRRRGMGLALATSGHRRYVDLALGGTGLAGLFDVEVTGEMVAHGKPAPDTYQRAAELLGSAPSNCLALEDAPNGVASAKAAGMWCIAVPDAHAERARFDAADAVVDSLAGVLDVMAPVGD
jgi:HAD superfamily hydrolase (TIGR01509 family)